MFGQWVAEVNDQEPNASVRIELEQRAGGYWGHAYLFYPNSNYPGFRYHIRLPLEPPHRAALQTVFLYSDGGEMTQADRDRAVDRLQAERGIVPPPMLDAVFSMEGGQLKVEWTSQDGRGGSVLLTKSDPTGDSVLQGRQDLATWNQFREWAVDQSPRNFVFRGQRTPRKLVSSFHRTWRKDLRTWIVDDVSMLFGAVAERLNYPLQMGNLQHNAAIWNILQHHGYPTPLIDWSFSPFVAAFFAFQSATDATSAPRIYAFDQARWNDRYGKIQFFVDAAPDQLVVLETMAVANPRHVPQQSISTVTNIADVEAFIRGREQEDGQAYLTACDLPVGSRPQIMRELELMGITYGSLFPGLDGICRDMRDRLFAEPR